MTRKDKKLDTPRRKAGLYLDCNARNAHASQSQLPSLFNRQRKQLISHTSSLLTCIHSFVIPLIPFLCLPSLRIPAMSTHTERSEQNEQNARPPTCGHMALVPNAPTAPHTPRITHAPTCSRTTPQPPPFYHVRKCENHNAPARPCSQTAAAHHRTSLSLCVSVQALRLKPCTRTRTSPAMSHERT